MIRQNPASSNLDPKVKVNTCLRLSPTSANALIQTKVSVTFPANSASGSAEKRLQVVTQRSVRFQKT